MNDLLQPSCVPQIVPCRHVNAHLRCLLLNPHTQGLTSSYIVRVEQIPSVNAVFDESNNGTSLLSPGSAEMVDSAMTDCPHENGTGGGASMVSAAVPAASPPTLASSPVMRGASAAPPQPSPPSGGGGPGKGRRTLGALFSRAGGSQKGRSSFSTER